MSAPGCLSSRNISATTARAPLALLPEAMLTSGTSSSAWLWDSRSLCATSLLVLLSTAALFLPLLLGHQPHCHHVSIVNEQLLQKNSFWEQALFTLKQMFTSLRATQLHNHQNQHGTQGCSFFLYLSTGRSQR